MAPGAIIRHTWSMRPASGLSLLAIRTSSSARCPTSPINRKRRLFPPEARCMSSAMACVTSRQRMARCGACLTWCHCWRRSRSRMCPSPSGCTAPSMSQQQPRGSSTTTSRSWSSHSSSEYVSLSIRSWLGLDRREPPEFAPLREALDALDHLDADRARYLAAFAYLHGRVEDADLRVSAVEYQVL